MIDRAFQRTFQRTDPDKQKGVLTSLMQHFNISCIDAKFKIMKATGELIASYVVICVLNAFLLYIAITLNVVTIHAIRKTSSLPKTLKTLLLSLAFSDLGVGLLVQPLFIVLRVMELKSNSDNNPTYDATYIAFLIPVNLFSYASLLIVMALSTDRFLTIYLYLSYKEIVTYKRVVAAVISVWVFCTFLSLIRLWISVNIIYVMFAIIEGACVIITAFFTVKIYMIARGHINQIQALQVQHASQDGEMANAARVRKFAVTAIYIYLVLLVCYFPNICVLYVGTLTSGSSTDIKVISHYTLTLVFLNSTLNPLIYCWKMRHIRNTVINTLRSLYAFTFQLRQE